MELIKIEKPGLFSVSASADDRRGEFDCKNQTLLQNDSQVDFVFIGDSITEMWELHAYFGSDGQRIINRGIGGDCSRYLAKRFSADVLQLKPRYAVLLAGINDTWALDPDYGKEFYGEKPETVMKQSAVNFETIISMAEDKNLNLILCSILPTDCAWEHAQCEKIRQTYIRDFNEVLMNLAAEHNFIYVDYYSAMVETDSLAVRKGITLEGVHPNALGYNVMADVLRKTLAEHNIVI